MSDDDLMDAGDDWAAAMAEQAAVESENRPDTSKLPKAQFEDLGLDTAKPVADNENLELILDIPVNIAMEVGRTKISIRNLLQLNQGSIVELDRLAGEPLDVLVNGTLIAHGEVVVINEKYGIRLTDVISTAERVKKLA
jgi:flagellar motor switch protein FliN/FliY